MRRSSPAFFREKKYPNNSDSKIKKPTLYMESKYTVHTTKQ
uniref:Uncharacterized protein n=1 Tax=Arundo donax TaxID=35708 RepID=A0A0A9FNT9_ARUDO